MATFVVTFILITRISVCKMDADFKEKRRERISSQRETRWSMNSQRLEEIVAELMRPIGDLRHNFDTDLSALLEEYLTEAGLHALEAEEGGAGAGAGAGVANFPELALLLQQSASIYGRKVDFLYQHVLSISDSLHNSTIEITNASTEQEPQTPSGTSRRKRKASEICDLNFTHIELEAHAAARRAADPPRPPPTLPRMYLELEPRVMADHDVPLTDYSDEPIGLLSDFHVSWRLQDGRLTEELSDAASDSAPQLRAIPLLELQAAIEAHAPPALPTPPPSPSPAPCACSTPLPEPEPEHEPEMPPPVLPVKKERKRRSELNIDDLIGGSVKLLISKEVLSRLGSESTQEFSLPCEWVAQTVRARCRLVRAHRARLQLLLHDTQFRGFDFSCLDVSGFSGWSSVEASRATEHVRDSQRLSTRLHSDSEDDGFFEQSSLADSDASSPNALTHLHLLASSQCVELESWRAEVVRRALEQEARGGVDVRALASTVLRDLPAPPAAPRPFSAVLAACAAERNDVSRLFLATLFLANAGNVEVIPSAPLSLDSFSLRLVSADAALYCAAADAEGDLFR